MSLKYLPDNLTQKTVPVKMKPAGWRGDYLLPGQGVMGYGKKITTTKKVLFGGKWYRIYATCFSNAASHWITVKGQRYYLRG